MNDRKRKYSVHFLALAMLTTVALSMVNFLAMSNNTRIDLTTDKRFTLSEGTKKIFERLTEPITVTYYVDEQLPSARVNLERDVTDKLKELQVSSNGKMTVKIERISEAEVSERKPELEALGIREAVDVKIVGKDTSAAARGVQEFYSSIEVRYSGAEPYVINDIFNLVSENDHYAEHRVDTLEFDITYALLRMKNSVSKQDTRTLVQTMDDDLSVFVMLSEQMPTANPKLSENITAGVQELKSLAGEKMTVIKQTIPYGESRGMITNQVPLSYYAEKAEVSASTNGLPQADFFFALVIIRDRGGNLTPVTFKDETDVESVITRLNDDLWELLKPRNRVGVIHPPVAPPSQRNPQGGQSPYAPATQYIRENLGYEMFTIDFGTMDRVPEDISLLLVFESNILTERQLYEIERYLLQGGNVMMFHQGWHVTPNIFPAIRTVNLGAKDILQDHVRDWAENIGVEFSNELLIQKNGTMKPFSGDGRRTQIKTVYTDMTFSPVVSQDNFNQESVFSRGMTELPMPMPVAIKLNNTKVSSAGLESQKLMTLAAKDLFRFIPEHPNSPAVDLDWRFDDKRYVELDPSAKAGKEIRLQAVGEEALIGVSLSGTFNSYWSGKNSKVPEWSMPKQGDKFGGKDAPELTAQPGRLTFFSSVGMFKIEYINGIGASDRSNVQTYFMNTVRFYRNFMDASIYGEDLVSLRSKSGIAPRIGTVESADKTVWYLICLGGTPLALALAALLLNIMRNNKRREYEAALGIQTGASND